ncbi:GMC family oxidoreductase N-terminal domain-containing protein [Streptomyces lydicus]|nr:GMC family oxidoreductase N-terminal domain-containing protein [Streptomyces lydicus]
MLWEPPPRLLARWAAQSGIGGYRAEDLEVHLKTVTTRLGVITQRHGEGNRDSQLLAAGAERLSWGWQHADRAVRDCLHRNRCTTGCTSGAKQSMAVSYLPQAEALGAEIRPDTRVVRVLHDGRTAHGVLAVGPDGARTVYRARAVFLAAGPLGTPALLQRSRIQHRAAGRRLSLHVNLRTIARFPEEVHAGRGTIFTAQVKEFGDQGVLIMPANVSRGSLAAALAGRPAPDTRRLLADFDHLGVFTTQVRLHGTAAVRAVPGGGLLLRHAMTAVDHSALRDAFRKSAELLFSAGATELTRRWPRPRAALARRRRGVLPPGPPAGLGTGLGARHGFGRDGGGRPRRGVRRRRPPARFRGPAGLRRQCAPGRDGNQPTGHDHGVRP